MDSRFSYQNPGICLRSEFSGNKIRPLHCSRVVFSATKFRMLHPGRRCVGKLIAGWAAALLGAAIFTPSAHATCGDYIQIGNMASKHAASTPAMPDSHSTPAPGQPCHGPFCSKQPAAPMEAPATRVTVQVEPWAFLTASRQPDSNRATQFLVDAEYRRPVENPSSIFRPPR